MAVRLVSVSRAWGSNRCLQQVPLGRGLEAHLGLYPEHLHPGPGYIIRPSEIKISWGRLGSAAVHLAPKTVPGLPTRPELDIHHHP